MWWIYLTWIIAKTSICTPLFKNNVAHFQASSPTHIVSWRIRLLQGFNSSLQIFFRLCYSVSRMVGSLKGFFLTEFVVAVSKKLPRVHPLLFGGVSRPRDSEVYLSRWKRNYHDVHQCEIGKRMRVHELSRSCVLDRKATVSGYGLRLGDGMNALSSRVLCKTLGCMARIVSKAASALSSIGRYLSASRVGILRTRNM